MVNKGVPHYVFKKTLLSFTLVVLAPGAAKDHRISQGLATGRKRLLAGLSLPDVHSVARGCLST